MVSVLASSVVGRVLKPLPGQFEDYTIGICCFSAKHAPLMNKTNDWLDRDHVSEWGDMSTHALLFQWAIIINPAGTPGYRNGTESFFGLKGRPTVVRDVEIHNQPVLRMRRK